MGAFDTWCPKGCEPYRDAVRADQIPFEQVTGKPPPYDKAGTVDATKKILVDRAWWAGRSQRERHAILAHEHGHVIGMECEDCCDRHAGYLMATWGYTQPAIQAAFGFMTRPDRMGAGERAAQGARYATTASASGAGVDAKSPATTRLQAAKSSPARGIALPSPPLKGDPPPKATAANPLPVDVPKDPKANVTITDPSFTGQAPATKTSPLVSVDAGFRAPAVDLFAPSTPGDPNLIGDALADATAHPQAAVVGGIGGLLSGLVVAVLVFVVIKFGGKT